MFGVVQMLVQHNNLSQQIIVIPGKVEEVEVPEEVDTIISEPMGYMLFNERMLESYLHAKKWLKPGGEHIFYRGSQQSDFAVIFCTLLRSTFTEMISLQYFL